MPAVSVVVPTHQRPTLVTRAVHSALRQSFPDLEVVVVVDGRDEETCVAVEEIRDRRLRIIVPDRNLGNAGARNAGIAEARGEWVALLDDDDLWKAEKLERQMERATATEARLPVVSCRFEAVSFQARYVWPRRFPRENQPLCEYLFTRRGPSVEGAVQTSTFVAPRALFEAVRFDETLNRYVDLDWLLRAACVEGFALVFAPGEPLTTYSIDEERVRISNEPDWRRDVDWIRERRHLVTPRAYGGYLLTQASIRAERSRDWSAFLPLLRSALLEGRVSAGEVVFHVANTFLPRPVRRRLTSRPSRGRSAGGPAAGGPHPTEPVKLRDESGRGR